MGGDKAELVLNQSLIFHLNRKIYCSAGFLSVVPVLRGLTFQS